MNTTPLENELLRYTKGLSKEALREVIDFVLILRKKRLKKTTNNLSLDLSFMNAEQTAHLEKKFEDYKKLYPRE